MECRCPALADDTFPARRVNDKGVVELSFVAKSGNIAVNKGMNKFTLHGEDKVNAQWQMYCLVHNIEKQ